MTTARKLRDAALCGTMLLAMAIMLRTSARHPSDLNFLDRGILRLSAPLQAVLSGAAHAVLGVGRHYLFVVGVKAENERLSQENKRLQNALLAAERQLGREGDLERLLGLQLRTPAETVAARIIGMDTNVFFRVARVRLERGEAEVQPGMAVLVPEGVVGRIERVYGPWADVLLSVDPKSAIDVVLPRTGVRGILRGAGARDRYLAQLEYAAQGDKVMPGDLVVTSGLGGVFPRDVPVGKIVRIAARESGLFQQANVAPAVDFARLEQVLVLLTAPPPENARWPSGASSHSARVVPYQ